MIGQPVTRLYSDDAELYDIAFDWDLSAEVDWLVERLGRPRSVLEPGCGSGRMLAALAEGSRWSASTSRHACSSSHGAVWAGAARSCWPI